MIELSPRQTVIVAILVLFLGKYLTSKLAFLREYNIPEPVSGGLIAYGAGRIARPGAQPGRGTGIRTMRERPEGQGSSSKQLGPGPGNPQ